MKLMITGAGGFVGKNLCESLKNIRDGKDQTHSLPPFTLYEYDRDNTLDDLERYCRDCDFVFHLAGVNRPERPEDFQAGNRDFTALLLAALARHGNPAPVLLASSTQAEQDNPYGQSKRQAEALLTQHGRETGAKTLIYRFPNLFGKWCRPHYNSVVATFCHQIARGLPVRVDDPGRELCLGYIDDVVEELLSALLGREHREGEFCVLPVTYRRTVGELARLIRSFRESRESLSLPQLGDPFVRKLYAAYLSYLPEDGFAYSLPSKGDDRGTFSEFLKSPGMGQVSVNVIRPGETKGQHWHHTKHEKFLVVSGSGLIQLRKIGTGEIVEYPVDGENLRVVEIPAGYTHNLKNTGTTDLAAVIWASEVFDPERPDTYFEPVQPLEEKGESVWKS